MAQTTTEFVWRPDEETLDRANVVRLMRRHGIDDYWELVRRSQDDPEWFWPAAIDGDTLLVGAGAPGSSVKHPANELIAYSIDERRAGTGAADGRVGAGGLWRLQ